MGDNPKLQNKWEKIIKVRKMLTKQSTERKSYGAWDTNLTIKWMGILEVHDIPMYQSSKREYHKCGLFFLSSWAGGILQILQSD